jgi:aminoglycoside phosphotransferase (APT) family kinase protein
MSLRIEELCEIAADRVKTHGDVKTHNIIMTPTRPVLVDWDSVRLDSAALEVGRAAFIVGATELTSIRRILASYVASGGDLTWAGQDLFLSVARHDLQALFERIRVSLGQTTAAWWMGDNQAIEQNIDHLLRALPHRFEHLSYLGSKTSDIGSS